MSESLVEAKICEIRGTFWQGIHESVAALDNAIEVEDEIANSFGKAVDASVPSFVDEFMQLLEAVRDASFPDFMNFSEMDAHAFRNGDEFLRTFVGSFLGQLVWQRDAVIAKLLPEYYGPDYAKEVEASKAK